MPAYIASPFKPTPKLLVPGIPSYLWGNFATDVSPTSGFVLSDSGNGTTSSVTVKIQAGNIPVVSATSAPLISIVGTANAAGAYNATNAPIVSVSAPQVPDQGVYTFTFLGAGTSAVAPDAGLFIAPQPETSEVLVAASSMPVLVAYGNLGANLNQGMTAVVSFPTLPTAALVVLQQALVDQDSEYATVATVATVAGGAITVGPQITVDPTLGRFFRFNTSGITGSGTLIAKLMI